MRRGIALVSLLACTYAAAQLALGARIHTTRGNANIRVAPAMDAEIITMLSRDNEIVVDSGGSSWTRVKLAEGQHGYVATRLLEAPDPALPRTRLMIGLAAVAMISGIALVARRSAPAAVAMPVRMARAPDVSTPLPT